MNTLKASLVEYSGDDGHTISKKPIEVFLATSGKDPVAEIMLKGTGRVHRAIHIPLRLLRRRLNDAMDRAGI